MLTTRRTSLDSGEAPRRPILYCPGGPADVRTWKERISHVLRVTRTSSVGVPDRVRSRCRTGVTLFLGHEPVRNQSGTRKRIRVIVLGVDSVRPFLRGVFVRLYDWTEVVLWEIRPNRS